MKNMEVVLANSLDAIIQNIGSSRDLIESTKARATFGQELLDAEYSRFEEGKSDSRRVFDVEDGLCEARIEEMDALVAYQKTLILLELAEGSYLKNRGIEIRAK
jgi:outer membrane protein TolC